MAESEEEMPDNQPGQDSGTGGTQLRRPPTEASMTTGSAEYRPDDPDGEVPPPST